MQDNSDQELESYSFYFQGNQKIKPHRFNSFFNNINESQKQILPAQCSTIVESNLSKSKNSSSYKNSLQKTVSSEVGKQVRQRKKKYLINLQASVEQLQLQVRRYDEEIQKTKETLALTLNSTKNNQNSITYDQLQLCISSEDPNEDKINLLLDMIKFRIGASGHERQAKIQYFFKQLMNTLFPAIHRYLMYCSEKNLDIFQEHSIDQFFGPDTENQEKTNCLAWTTDFLYSLQMTEKQRQCLISMKPKYISKKFQVKNIISSLKEIKYAIKKEEEVFENMIDKIRIGLRPVQAAAWVLFSDKSKYKRDITLENQLELNESENAKKGPLKKVKKY